MQSTGHMAMLRYARAPLMLMVAAFLLGPILACKPVRKQPLSSVLDDEGGATVQPHIRWMIRRDMREVLAIEKEVFGDNAWVEEDFIRTLRQRNAIGMVAEIGDKVVGFMVYELHKESLHLLNMAVSKEFQGKDVGRQMSERLLGKLSQQRRQYVFAVSKTDNKGAHSFFEKTGAKRVLELKNYYGPGEHAFAFVYKTEGVPDITEDRAKELLRSMGAIQEAHVSPDQPADFSQEREASSEGLAEYRDIVEKARRGKPPFEVADVEAIEAIRVGLRKKEVGSVVILAEGGTGKTKLVESFAYEVAQGTFPEINAKTKIFEVSAATLGATDGYAGQFEAKVKKIIDAANKGPIILFMDEIHSLAGQGTHSNNTNDFFEYIKTYLANGRIRIIATSTEHEFNETFGGREAVYARFDQYIKKPLTRAQIIKAINFWNRRFGYEVLPENICAQLIDISDRFDAVGAQPRKVAKLLDHLYAMKSIDGNSEKPVSVAEVRAAASEYYQLDAMVFDRDEQRKRIDSMVDQLGKRFVGREKAIQTLQSFTRRGFVNLGKQGDVSPTMRLMFAGPKGTAKTQLAKAYAEYMGFDSRLIEMNGYSQSSGKTADDLLREIAENVRRNGSVVLILDEIEKADVRIQNRLLSAFNDGFFYVKERTKQGDTQGKSVKVSLRNVKFILTTNAGQDHVRAGDYTRQSLKGAIERERVISEFLLDRIQEVVGFDPPRTRKEFKAVLEGHLARLIQSTNETSGNPTVKLSNANKLLEDITEKHYREDASPRRAIEDLSKTFTSMVTDELFEQENPDQCKVLNIKFKGLATGG